MEATIPYGLLNEETIPTDISGAVDNANGTGNLFDPTGGALFNDKENLYVYGGVPGDIENNVLARYELSSKTWSNVTVKGGDFNHGNRSDGIWTSVPESSLSFILGGRMPFTGPSMLRLDTSNQDYPTWTNESLGSGSYGVEVPNLGGGNMAYIPAGSEGMLVVFGG